MCLSISLVPYPLYLSPPAIDVMPLNDSLQSTLPCYFGGVSSDLLETATTIHTQPMRRVNCARNECIRKTLLQLSSQLVLFIVVPPRCYCPAYALLGIRWSMFLEFIVQYSCERNRFPPPYSLFGSILGARPSPTPTKVARALSLIHISEPTRR